MIAIGLGYGTVFGTAGFAMAFLGLPLKARLEERRLAGELGSGAYADYRRRVPMRVPGWPVRADPNSRQMSAGLRRRR